MEPQTSTYYAIVFAIAFGSAFFRAWRDDLYSDRGRCLAFAFTGGSLAFGLVSLGNHYGGNNSFSHFAGFGAAAILGLSSKECDQFGRYLIKKILKKIFGIEEITKESQSESKDGSNNNDS